MIAGQPPFQSSSQKEIYDRARNVDYTWPPESKHSNDIPDEAKDLVARLLKVDAERRPDPDQIVGHAFFSMYGGDAIPARMEDYFRETTPRFLDQKARPRGDVMVKGTERLSLRILAKECGVGYLPGALAPQATVGSDIGLSLYRECAAEEAAGLGPIVPLPNDMVYISKHSLSDWPSQPAKKVGFEPDVEFVKENIVPARASQEAPVQQSRKASGQRGPVQSHAATLRAAQAGGRAASSKIDPRLLDAGRVPDIPQEHFAGSTRTRRGLLNELPLRPTNNSSAASKAQQEAPMKEPRQRATRSRKVINLDEDEEPAKAQPPRAMTKDEYIDATSPNPDEKRSKMAARARARIASNIQREMSEESKPSNITASSSEPPRSKDNSSTTPSIQNLINPDEPYEQLPLSKPEDVLIGLRALHRNLSNHLNNIPSRKSRLTATEINAKSKSSKQRPVVVKWVDYSNKFGIGYILANGTAGCVFKASSIGDRSSHPTCIVVPGAENHLRQRKAGTASYPDITQLVPLRGPAIEFVENCGLDGLKRVIIPASTYRTEPSDSGTEGRLGPGLDSFDHERRKKLCLWDKFGKYMTQTPCKEDHEAADSPLDNPPPSSSKVTAPFITFYERLGNTGIWAFSDTSLQFNFPDHTKVVISSAGEWIDFYLLPLAGAQRLQRGQKLKAEDLADRSILCYPTDILLKGEWGGHNRKWGDVTAANQMREKIAFARDVVGQWIEHGGLGRMGDQPGEFGVVEDGRPMMWEGMREVGGDKGKMVWVSVGARGGDGRVEIPAKEVKK
ncbi:MAG: Cell cycle serine/threonine-protein kinase cdc5/MSD2 [Ramalina farinacea]|uniref:Cell cycle serine/threonine-protein kinase cdc5/MSD2 n=1 Tax=Ramalina farinacea TaxID=258253 RepID=A0AA43QM80_9LECA|nr:Cell cycle serine/threonine-protein kinase cdc5/MSD2 [Ramalina farinacea]